MKTNEYCGTPTNLTFHNLTTNKTLPSAAHHLLGLGLKYVPTPKLNITESQLDTSFARLDRDIGLKTFFAGAEDDYTYTNTNMRLKSTWRAPLLPSEIDSRIHRFTTSILRHFTQKPHKPNITPFQRRLLKQLQDNKEVIITSADKGLGPVAIDTKQYIEMGLTHLLDPTTYTILSETQAYSDITTLRRQIFAWTQKHNSTLDTNVVNYIRHHINSTIKDPFGYFYLLIKLHKTPISSRPVCSDCASLPHALGKWVDTQLQPIVKQQATYFKNSFALKQQLDTITLPPNACIFTYDAISMYTNIDTTDCIHRLSKFISLPETQAQYPHLSPNALIDALDLIMHSNRMKFGDLYAHQLKGIAMGMSPAPSIANLYVALYERDHIVLRPHTALNFLRRFIDDGFGIWLRDPDPRTDNDNWTTFQHTINNMGLTWEFSPRSNTVNFMDIVITLTDGKFTTKLYSKPIALHLYIPPSSCHAPGVATGLIFGHILRLYQLCSHQHDINNELKQFHDRLTARGYPSSSILPLFHKAEENARRHIQRHSDGATSPLPPTTRHNPHQIFFHIPYHPANPPSRVIQHLWHQHVATPLDKPPLHTLTNAEGYRIPISKLTVAYSRPSNIGNLLSCRKLKVNTGYIPPPNNTTSPERL